MADKLILAQINLTMTKIFYGLLLFLAPCAVNAQKTGTPVYQYKPDSQELHDAIVRMDSIFFDAYNHCKMEVQAAIYSDSIEFYHDRGGVSTSKKDILEGTKKNICGKVTRQLVPGSIEVYPIKDFGAVEIGMHKFFNNQEPNAEQRIGKFIIFWKQTGNDWKIVKVVSLH